MLNYSEKISDTTLEKLEKCHEVTESMVTFEEGLLLYRLAKAVREGCIVEVGTYRGGSTVFLGHGSLDGNKVQIYAIDPHERFVGVLGGQFGPQDRTAFYKTMLASGCSEIVSLINLTSEIFAPRWTKKISLLWLDGDHRYAGVRKDFECWVSHLTDQGVIAFDDATDDMLGPYQLIDELISSGKYEVVHEVGKIVVIQRTAARAKFIAKLKGRLRVGNLR